MKSKTYILILLLSIFLAGLLLRIYQLANLPAILNWDEAALAYNGLLLNLVGMDEWQRSWPLALQSFGDYKLLGYPLVLSLLFNIFDPTDFIVRLPALLAGSLLIIIAYVYAVKFNISKKASLISALIVALSPVFFVYSRSAYEATLALAISLIGFWLLLFYSSKNVVWKVLVDVIALILLALAAITYNTPFLLLPFLIPILVLVKGINNWKNWLWSSLGILIIISVLFIPLFNLNQQKSGITIFSDETVWQQTIDYRLALPESFQPVFGSRYVWYLKIVLENTLFSLGPKFMVFEGGGHPWHSINGWGNIYLIVYLLGLIGLVTLLYKSAKSLHQKKLWRKNKYNFALLYLLMISLIPSVITVDAPHTTRSLWFLFWFVIISTYGLDQLLKYVRSNQHKVIYIIIVAILVMGQFFSFWQTYFTTYKEQQSRLFLAGFDQVIQSVNAEYPDQEIAIVDRAGYHYILTSWYLKLKPADYYPTVIKQLENNIGFRYGERVTNYHFIADRNDRSSSEKILIEWIDSDWHISSFE